MATYTNSHAKFDCAIDGTPFFLGPTSEFPYVRQSGEFRRQQLDVSGEPGEQSLTSWWYRSQSSFHLGAGLKFYDPIRGNQNDQYRFYDSAGVDVFAQRGQVSLLRQTTRIDTTSSWGDMVGWANAGDSGLLYEDGYALYCYKVSTGTSFEVDYEDGNPGTDNIWDIDVSGEKYFVISNDGIYAGALPGAGGTKRYDVAGADDRGYVKWVKERLFATINNRIYEISDLSPASPTLATDYAGNGDSRLLYTHAEDAWAWNGIEAGPDCIFFSGYAGTDSSIHGHKSCVYASTLEVANIDDAPQVTQPTVVAELPHGEFILSMCSYLGTYLILTTTKGVRVCAIGAGGQLRVGPLTIEAPDYSYHATVWDRYVFCTGASVDGYDGVWKIDLSAPVDDTGLRFAYAKDIASGHATASSGYPARVAMLGRTGRVALMVDNSGVWVEHASDLVTSGWIQTGEIRFDTWQEKIFQYLRSVYDRTTAGNVQPYWVSEAGSATSLGAAANVSGVPYRDTDGSDGTARLGVSYKWVLTQATSTTGPAFRGYQAQALPANVVQREIQLPLLCYRKERSKAGRTVTRPVWDRVEAIEALERGGTVVPFQDFNTGESRDVTVTNVRFVSDRPAQSQTDADNPGGMLLVTLRSAD